MKFDMPFLEFKEEYMNNLNGYIPTYVTADEEYDEEGFIRLSVELIAPWRMTDGPSRFFRVITIDVDKDQYEEIKKYMAAAGEKWKEELIKISEDCLRYSNKFEKK